MEPTRKTSTEGKYLLITTKSNLYYAQRETENLLAKYYRKNQTYNNQTENPGRRKKPLVHNHFSTYAEVLSKCNATSNNKPTQYSSSAYHRLVAISFNSKNEFKDYFKPSPSQK